MPAPSRFLRQQQVKYSTCWYCWQCSDQGDGSSKGGTVFRKGGRFSGKRDGSPEEGTVLRKEGRFFRKRDSSPEGGTVFRKGGRFSGKRDGSPKRGEGSHMPKLTSDPVQKKTAGARCS